MNFDSHHVSCLLEGTLYAQKSTEYIVYHNIIIGLIFKSLYLWNNAIPWYDYFLFFLLFLSHSIIYYALIRRFSEKAFFIIPALHFGVIVYSLVRIYFTVTAGFVGLAGLILVLQYLKDSKRRFLFYAFVLIQISFWLRVNSWWLVFILFTPLIIFCCIQYRSKFRRNYLLNCVFFVMLSVFSMVITSKWNTAYYNDNPQWADYLVSKKYMTDMLDYERLPIGPNWQRYKRSGWSKNDYYMLKSWFFVDQSFYNRKNLERLFKGYTVFTFKYIKNRGVVEFFGFMYEYALRSAYILPQLLFAVCCFMLFQCRNKWLWFLFSVLLAELVFGITVFYFFYKITFYHVGYLMFMTLPIMILCVIEFEIKKNIIALFSLISILLLITYNVHQNYIYSQENKRSIQAYHEMTEDLDTSYLYVWCDAGFSYVAGKMFDSPCRLKNLDLIHLGLFAFPELTQETLSKYQLTNIHEGIINHPKALIISSEIIKDFYAKYMKQHYNRDIVLNLVQEKYGFKFYSVRDK